MLAWPYQVSTGARTAINKCRQLSLHRRPNLRIREEQVNSYVIQER